MCRLTAENGDLNSISRERDRLRIRAFQLRLSTAGGAINRRHLPETLTLVYLPRITGTPLEINGAKVRADTAAFVALHRIRDAGGSEAAFSNTDFVRSGEGVIFEIYIGAEKFLRGKFQRSPGCGGWSVECRCAAAAEVCVVTDGGALMREKVQMAAVSRRRRLGFFPKLQAIPEEGAPEICDCCGGMRSEEVEDEKWELVTSDGWDVAELEPMGGGDGIEMEGVKWAVDAGIWVICLGIGFLVSQEIEIPVRWLSGPWMGFFTGLRKVH